MTEDPIDEGLRRLIIPAWREAEETLLKQSQLPEPEPEPDYEDTNPVIERYRSPAERRRRY